MSKATPTYAEIIRKIMRDRNLTRRDLEAATEFSYEHVRKIVGGLPLQSEKFNERLCAFLNLDTKEMWSIAIREKLLKHGPQMFAMAQPDMRLKEIWEGINQDDRERLIKIGEGMLEQRRAERGEREEDDPDQLRARINELMERLVTVSSSGRIRPSHVLTSPSVAD